MNKTQPQLIRSSWFSPASMKEALDRSPAKKVDLIAQGYKPTGQNASGILAELENFPLAYYDTPTSNKQIFTRDLWQSLRSSSDIESRMIKTRSFWGMPYHDDDTEIKLPQVSHKVRDFQIDPDSPFKLVSGKVAILDTPNGVIIHSLMQDAYVGISSRGWGSLYDADDGQNQIVSAADYLHVCWDMVGIPAVGPAMATLMNSLKTFDLQEPILQHLLRFPIPGLEPIVASLQASRPKSFVVSGDIPVPGGDTSSPADPAPSGEDKAALGPVEWWTSSSGRIELEIPLEVAASINHSGPADADVAAARKIPFIAEQLDKIDQDTLAAELKEYGAWDDEELADREASLDRLLWVAACDVDDEHFQKNGRVDSSKKPVPQAAGGSGGDRAADVAKAGTFFGKPSDTGPGVWNWDLEKKGDYTLCLQISEKEITTYWFNPRFKAPVGMRVAGTVEEAKAQLDAMKAMNPGKEFPAAANRKQGLPQSFKSRATIQNFVQALPPPEAKALLEFSQGVGIADPVTLSRACIARLEDNRQDVRVKKLMALAGADGSFGNLGNVLESLMAQVEDNAAIVPVETPQENVMSAQTNPKSTLGGKAKPVPQMFHYTPPAGGSPRDFLQEITRLTFIYSESAKMVYDLLKNPRQSADIPAANMARNIYSGIKHDEKYEALVSKFGFQSDGHVRTAIEQAIESLQEAVKASASQSQRPVKSADESGKTNLPGEPGVPELPEGVGLDTGAEGEPEGTPEERAEFDKMVLLELDEQALGEDLDGDGDFPDEEYPTDFEELKQARKILAAAGEVVPSEDTPPEGEPGIDEDDDRLESFDDSEIQVDLDANTITLDTCGPDGEPCREEYKLEDGYLTLTGDDTGIDDPDEAPVEPVDLFTETNGDVQEAVDYIMDLQAGADTVVDMTDEYAEEPVEEPGAEGEELNK